MLYITIKSHAVSMTKVRKKVNSRHAKHIIKIDFATLKKSSIEFNYVFYQVYAWKIYVHTAL